MKPMLDNDIDNLFKSSFEDYEVKPSKEGWHKISTALKTKSNKSKQSYWLAAASVLIVFGLGLNFFSSPKQVIKLTGRESDNLLDDDNAVLPIVSRKIQTKQISRDLTLEEVKQANEQHFLSLVANNIQYKEVEKQKAKFKDEYSLDADAKEIYQQEEGLQKVIKNQKVIANNITKDDLQKVENKPEESVLNSLFEKEAQRVTERSVIKSVGDLVNFVVAKVDGREKKLIHFSKTEESDMEITEINLGLFKYKKN